MATFSDWCDLMLRANGLGPTLATKLSAEGLRVNGQPYPPARSIYGANTGKR